MLQKSTITTITLEGGLRRKLVCLIYCHILLLRDEKLTEHFKDYVIEVFLKATELYLEIYILVITISINNT